MAFVSCACPNSSRNPFCRKVGIATVIGVAMTILFGPVASPSSAVVRDARINLGQMTSTLNTIFAGMRLKLNNYNGSHHISKASYLQWPPFLSGGKARLQRFTIPEVRQGPFFYYISDVNLKSIRFSLSGGRVLLRIAFEGRGTELPGRCFVIRKHVPSASTRAAYRALCAIGNDKAAPDAQWNNLSVTVAMLPKARKGNIYLVDPRVTVGGTLQIGGICGLGFDICNKILGYKKAIRNLLASRIRGMLASSRVQREIANIIRRHILAPRKIELVASARIVGRTLVLRHGFPSGDELNKRSYCLRYTKLAVAAHRQNLRNRCGFRGKGWSANVRGHRAWCMGAPVQRSRGETTARQGALKACAARQQKSYCDKYVRQAYRDYAANKRYRCGFNSLMWTARGARLTDWCKQVSIGESQRVARARKRQLASCTRNRKRG